MSLVTIVLQLLLHKELRFHTGHRAACVQCALGKLAHQAAAGAAVHKAVTVCTDPAAQFPDSCRQHRIIARICSKIDRDVHGIPPFVFSILPRSGPIEKGHPLANAAALWYS